MPTITINDIEYNSYVTLEEANAYLNVKYGFNWSTYDDDKKKLLLVNATREIDKREYQGCRLEKDQTLKFPRLIGCKETNQELVKQAAMELADCISLSNTPGGTTNLQAIKSMKVGDTDIEFKDDAVLEDTVTVAQGVIYQFLKTYLRGNAEVWL